MNTSVLILGANLGNRQSYLDNAMWLINSMIGDIVRKSSVYETEPWGYSDELQYLNQVVVVKTSLDPMAILSVINKIEQDLGRVRGPERYASRTIDIDILFYDDYVMETSELTIPHVQMGNRRFVLEPLAEIFPTLRHPVSGKSINEMLKECADVCKVKRLG